MRRRLVFWSVILGCAVLGAAGAALIAARRGADVSATRQYYLASMINPARSLESPRTYNQTLSESIDLSALAADLASMNYPVNSIQLDVLPDSYHIQATVGLTNEATASSGWTDTQAERLGQAIANSVGRQSASLASQLLEGSPTPTARVILTKMLPATTTATQDPVVTGLFGALAGALVGLFIGLSLPTKPTKSKK